MGNGQYLIGPTLPKTDYASGLNINFSGGNNSSSTGQEIASTILGIGGSIGGLLLAGLVSKSAGGSSAAGSGSQAQQTQLSPQQQEILSICEEYDLAGMQQEITTMDAQINDLNAQKAIQTSYKNLETNNEYTQNEAQIKDLESKYGFGTGNAPATRDAQTGRNYQNIQTQIDNLKSEQTRQDSREIELKADLGKNGDGKSGSIATNIGQLTNRIIELDSLLKGKYANPKTEQEKNEKFMAEQEKSGAAQKKTELEKQQQSEINEYKQLQGKKQETSDSIEALEKQLNALNASEDIKAAYKSYQACLAKRTELKGKQTGAEQAIIQLDEQLSQLNIRKVLFNQAMQYETKLTKDKSSYDAKVSDAADKYAEADKNDGNWWKRHMPKWLGGSSKSDRNNMKLAHQDKKDAGAALENLGVDSSNYSLKNQAKQKTTQLYNSLSANGKNYFDWKRANEYFKNNPTATVEDAKQALQLTHP